MAKQEAAVKRTPVSEMSQAQKNREIAALKQDLENANDPVDKRNIRAQLRRLGHEGGLGKPRTAPNAKGKGKPAAKKPGRVVGRRAQAAQQPA